jgi:hypothetical protein
MKPKVEKKKAGRPATGHTPKRYFRMGDEDWQQVESAAVALEETTSEYVRRVLLKDSGRILKNVDQSSS